MSAKKVSRGHLRLAVVNNSEPVLNMLCDWFKKHGHHCVTALLADMPNAHEDVPRLIAKHKPDVVVYDIGMPYESSWDLMEVIRTSPTLHAQPFVLTTPNRRKLREAVGATDPIDLFLAGPRSDGHAHVVAERLVRATDATLAAGIRRGYAGSLAPSTSSGSIVGGAANRVGACAIRA